MSDNHALLDNLPYPVLIGDIGGTNARFALIDADGAAKRLPTVHTAKFKTIDDAIQHAVIDETSTPPRSAVLAVAGPIAGERVRLTNCPWVVEPRKSIERFRLAEMILLNDFEAQSLSLPGLQADDVDPIGDGTTVPDGTRVVLGPGTGLGAGALVHARDIWVPVPGEGGHIDLGPRTNRDMAVWPHIQTKVGRVSAETLLCGSGMLRLYRAVAAADRVEPILTSQEAVTAEGLAGKDRQAAETLAMFATCLGRVAGDFALIFMATGGVFLGRRHQRQDRAGAEIRRLPPGLRRQGAARAPGRADGDLDHRQDGRGTRRDRGLRAQPGRLRRVARRPPLAGRLTPGPRARTKMRLTGTGGCRI